MHYTSPVLLSHVLAALQRWPSPHRSVDEERAARTERVYRALEVVKHDQWLRAERGD